MVARQEINFPGQVGGWLGEGEELEIRLSSGQRKLELGLSLSLTKSGKNSIQNVDYIDMGWGPNFQTFHKCK